MRVTFLNREKTIVRTGILGILANIFLAGFKAAVGILSGSIAVTLDAVNNLTDALSSVITIVSAKLAHKAPDRHHPYGHGRIEYVSAVTISVIVLYAGITSLVEAVKKIITPVTPDYTPAALVIIAVAVAVKIALGIHVSKTGRRVNSASLVAAGKDALLDAVISASTLAAAVIFIFWQVSLEAWLAAAISLVIIRSGIGMLLESVSSILGERAEGELANSIRESILTFTEISGVCDLVLHNYGPEMHIGSVHIEVPGDLTAKQLDLLERAVTERVYAETGVVLMGIGIYAKSDGSAFSEKVYSDLRTIVSAEKDVLQIHGFSADEAAQTIRFDVVIGFDAKNRQEIFRRIVSKLAEKYPSCQITPVMDADVTDF